MVKFNWKLFGLLSIVVLIIDLMLTYVLLTGAWNIETIIHGFKVIIPSLTFTGLSIGVLAGFIENE